ncbi:MAG: methyltransferase [Bacteroidota bacterium]
MRVPPVWLVKAINWFRNSLLRLNRKTFPGNVVLYEQVQHFWMLPSLYVAAKLDIATCLKAGPLTAEEIAGKVNAEPENIHRILRALSSTGIFKQTRDGRFGLNALARGLLDEQGSLRYMILHHLGPVNWNSMSNLEYAVRTGNNAFAKTYGKETYEYLAGHPDENALFDKSMSNLSDLGIAPILHVFDFSKYPLVADIGGGEGFLLANILHDNPACRGILMDTPRALEKAPQMSSRFRVDDRIQILPGDFFESIPASADLYILKNIIHNWGDERSAELLTKIRQSMNPGSLLLIIEMIVPSGIEPSLAKLLDIQMMATMFGGKERTEGEFASLLKNSGFEIQRIIPTITPISLIEAKKNG